ncbi:MAG: 2Fe-2S iron-sulfur cluster binding domain-containing protein [Chloroflexi bacterium]|nr:2Fe-2S iron-sulfur cluster binding domain-containing protein [Chloroflexota bacterium]
MVAFRLNGKRATVAAEPDTPLLWVLREHLKMTGTKYGCGMALCGACTVHVDGVPVRSCVMAVGGAGGNGDVGSGGNTGGGGGGGAVCPPNSVAQYQPKVEPALNLRPMPTTV